MSESIITVKNLTIRFPEHFLLENVSFEIAEGEAFGIYGGPESGKTGLLLALCGIKAFYDGEIMICGYPVQERKERYKQYIGLVTEGGSLFPEMTVGENIDFIAAIHGCSVHSPEFIAYQDKLICDLQLDNLMKKLVKRLNRGETKRTALACALLHQPKLLMLDEITKNIDTNSINILLNVINKYHQNGGTVIRSTSSLNDLTAFTHFGYIHDQLFSIGAPEKYAEHETEGSVC